MSPVVRIIIETVVEHVTGKRLVITTKISCEEICALEDALFATSFNEDNSSLDLRSQSPLVQVTTLLECLINKWLCLLLDFSVVMAGFLSIV